MEILEGCNDWDGDTGGTGCGGGDAGDADGEWGFLIPAGR